MDVDVTAAIQRGQNRFVIAAQSVDGPAAVALSLSLVSADGSRSELFSNSQWRVVKNGNDIGPAVSLGAVEPALWGMDRRPPLSTRSTTTSSGGRPSARPPRPIKLRSGPPPALRSR